MLRRFGGPCRVTLLVSTLVAAVALPQAVFEREAKAQSTEKRKVAVGAFEGTKSGDARSAFIDALKKDGGYEVTDAEDVKASAKPPALVEAAKNLGVSAIVTGKASKSALKLKVLNGADGSVIEEVELKATGGKLKAKIQKEGATAVASAIASAQVEEPKQEEAPAEETSSEASAEADSSASAPAPAGDGLSPFDVTLGLRPIHRSFKYHDTLADNRPGVNQPVSYELPLGPVLFIDLNWYPASHFTTGAAEWVGLTAGFEKGFAIDSVYLEGKPDERTLKTNEQQWYVGGRLRIPLGEQQLGAQATFGQHTFTLDGDEAASVIPDVSYTNVRVGIDGTFRIGELLIGARIGKRFVLSTGGLEEPPWYTNVKTSSLEAGGTVGYRLARSLDLVAGLDWLRYAFDFNPVGPRPPMYESTAAGGAIDEYLIGHIALRFHLPGASEPQAAVAAE